MERPSRRKLYSEEKREAYPLEQTKTTSWCRSITSRFLKCGKSTKRSSATWIWTTPTPIWPEWQITSLWTHPPVSVVIDAAEIAKACDGTLIAVNYNDVSRQELLDVKQQIEQIGCPILGTVLNQVDYDNYMGRKYYKSYSKYGKCGYYRKYYKRSHEAEKK